MFELGPYALLAPLHRDEHTESFIARAKSDPNAELLELHLATPKATRAHSAPNASPPLDENFVDAIAHDIKRMRDFGFEGSCFFTVTPSIDGLTLRALLEHEPAPLPPALARLIAAKLAAELAAIHASGAVHTALAPETIRIDRRGRVALVTTGLERALLHAGATDTSTPLAQSRGHIPYLAPAVLRFGGGSAPLDPSVDRIALGLVLYELLTGKRAHPPQDRLSLLARVASGPSRIAPLPAARPGLPLDLEPLLARLLAGEDVAKALYGTATEAELAAHLAKAHDAEYRELEERRAAWRATPLPATFDRFTPAEDRFALPKRMQNPRIVIQGPRVRRRIGFDLETRALFSEREYRDKDTEYRGKLRLVHAGGSWKLGHQNGVTFLSPDLAAGGGQPTPPTALGSSGTAWAYTSKNTLYLYRTTATTLGLQVGSVAIDPELDPFDVAVHEPHVFVLARAKRGGIAGVIATVVGFKLVVEATVMIPAGLEPVAQWVDGRRGLWRMLAKNLAAPAAGEALLTYSISDPSLPPRKDQAGAYARILALRGPGRAFAIAEALGAHQAWLARETPDGELEALLRLESDDGAITLGPDARADVLGTDQFAFVLIDDHFLVVDVDRVDIVSYKRLPLERDAQKRLLPHAMALRPGSILDQLAESPRRTPRARSDHRRIAIASSDVLCFGEIDEEHRVVIPRDPIPLPPIGRQHARSAKPQLARVESGYVLRIGELLFVLGDNLAPERGRMIPGLIGAMPVAGGSILAVTTNEIIVFDPRLDERERVRAPFELAELYACRSTGLVLAIRVDRRTVGWGSGTGLSLGTLGEGERVEAAWRDVQHARWVLLTRDATEEWRAAVANDEGTFVREALRAPTLFTAGSSVVAATHVAPAWIAVHDRGHKSISVAFEASGTSGELGVLEAERFETRGIASEDGAPVKPSIIVSGSRAYVALGPSIAVFDTTASPPELVFRAPPIDLSRKANESWGPAWCWSIAEAE